MYYIKEGKEITHNFFTENMFYMSIETIFQNQRSPFHIELLEHCKIRMIEYDELKIFALNHVNTLELFFNLLIDSIKRLSDRLSSIQFQSAQEKYNIMLESYPDILLRAPLGHIASYLGIAQQTLSVIRAEKAKSPKTDRKSVV